uniref:Uncharacterized protein n=1 Tax=Moorena producens (strain JHB) TaxID=1454205 RepID=A0A1D9FXT4_MOOP1
MVLLEVRSGVSGQGSGVSGQLKINLFPQIKLILTCFIQKTFVTIKLILSCFIQKLITDSS